MILHACGIATAPDKSCRASWQRHCTMQTQVEGIPFGNSAPLTAPTRVCQTTLYTIDEVMQPTNSLADIPGFQDLSE